MRVELITIGNSRGIRIPKPLIQQCGLGDTVDLRVTADGLVVTPRRAVRQGWREAFAASAPAKDEELLLENLSPNAFDSEEWEW
jgi:antitoxin MazE